ACCDELGIALDGLPHRALTDARATSKLVSAICSDDPTLLEEYRFRNIEWPSVRALKTPCYRREQAQKVLEQPPNFLRRIAAKVHHAVEAETPSVLAYMSLIDRVLEDRTIDQSEEEALVDAAVNWELSPSQLSNIHAQYLHNLAVLALADGVVTETERRDLHLVARLLGQDDSELDAILESAAKQLATAQAKPRKTGEDLSGQKVCFTGQIQATIDQEPITRSVAEALAAEAGLIVANSVTKKLDLLVVADPNSQSGKARKAREYGVRILSDAVFWRMAGIPVD
ncbi:MAG: BRCT domain-containing protein, partial [Candidatus Omnitrophica bacterium]|nr:BRCT domain-containing protein [Candidatus Omnitrophota bacterium]